MAQTTYLCDGRFGVTKCPNGSTIIKEFAGPSGILDPPQIHCVDDSVTGSDWAGVNMTIGACIAAGGGTGGGGNFPPEVLIVLMHLLEKACAILGVDSEGVPIECPKT